VAPLTFCDATPIFSTTRPKPARRQATKIDCPSGETAIRCTSFTSAQTTFILGTILPPPTVHCVTEQCGSSCAAA
jgi:hypothetical protein